MRLETQGFTVRDAEGRWRMRVPLFADWLRRYKDAYPLALN
jgi:hypothetical protein